MTAPEDAKRAPCPTCRLLWRIGTDGAALCPAHGSFQAAPSLPRPRSVAQARAGLQRALAGWALPVTRVEEEVAPLEGDGFAEVWPAHSDEWRKLAAGWGFGGICNAVDELAKRDPDAAPRHVIEAARLLRFVAEDLGIDSRHPLAAETWRSEP